MNQWKVEEFFDEHPNPFNVEVFNFEGLKSIKVYLDNTGETDHVFLFEITFNTWKQANNYTRILINHVEMCPRTDVFRIGKKLFLRKLFF